MAASNAIDARSAKFTPEIIDEELCMARVWGDGKGGQCQFVPETNGELCRLHLAHLRTEKGLAHGRVDGAVPEPKLAQFEKALTVPKPVKDVKQPRTGNEQKATLEGALEAQTKQKATKHQKSLSPVSEPKRVPKRAAAVAAAASEYAAGSAREPPAKVSAAIDSRSMKFTPEITNALCMARIWADGKGGQCQRAQEKDSDLCRSHLANARGDKGLSHGRVDGPVPAAKLAEFEKAMSRPPAAAKAPKAETPSAKEQRRKKPKSVEPKLVSSPAATAAAGGTPEEATKATNPKRKAQPVAAGTAPVSKKATQEATAQPVAAETEDSTKSLTVLQEGSAGPKPRAKAKAKGKAERKNSMAAKFKTAAKAKAKAAMKQTASQKMPMNRRGANKKIPLQKPAKYVR